MGAGMRHALRELPAMCSYSSGGYVCDGTSARLDRRRGGKPPLEKISKAARQQDRRTDADSDF